MRKRLRHSSETLRPEPDQSRLSQRGTFKLGCSPARLADTGSRRSVRRQAGNTWASIKGRRVGRHSCLRTNPARHLALELQCSRDQAEVDGNRCQAIRLFTDGSKIEDSVGPALSIWDCETETWSRKSELSSYCTVYQAKLLVICRATEVVLKSEEETLGTYCDSRTADESVRNWNTVHPLAVSATVFLLDSVAEGKKVGFFWVSRPTQRWSRTIERVLWRKTPN